MKRLFLLFILGLGLTFGVNLVTNKTSEKTRASNIKTSPKQKVKVANQETQSVPSIPQISKSNEDVAEETNSELNICSPVDVLSCECAKAENEQHCYDQQIEVFNQVYTLTFSGQENYIIIDKDVELEPASINSLISNFLTSNHQFAQNWISFQLENNKSYSCPTNPHNCIRDDLTLDELENAQNETLANREEEGYYIQREMDYNHQNNH